MKIYEISLINARVFSLLLTFPNEPIAFPFTEGSTETFTEGFSENCPRKINVVMVFRHKNNRYAELGIRDISITKQSGSIPVVCGSSFHLGNPRSRKGSSP